MTIRRATADDVHSIADLVVDQRIRQQAWDPVYWAGSGRTRTIDPLFLRMTLTDDRTEALVACEGDDIVGVAVGTPLHLHGDTRPTWLVDRIELASPIRWPALGPPLLAALAERATRHGAERLVLGCATADRHRRAALASAGLEVNCWYRHVRLDAVRRSALTPTEVAALPLPRVHAWSGLARRMESVTAPGAHALLSPPVPGGPAGLSGGSCGIADPVVAAHSDGLRQVLDELEGRARARGDAALVVVVSPGEEPLDLALDARGYRRPVEWWVWSPRSATTTPRQLQPLVEPHSWQT